MKRPIILATLALTVGLSVQAQFTQLPPTPPGGGNPYYNHYPGTYNYGYVRQPVSPADFAELVALVQNQTFPSSQLPMIKAAGLAGWFTCGQCAALMNIFSFDDNKLDVVRSLAPHLVNPMDCQPIMDALTFDSDRQTAWRIISQGR